MTADPVSGIRAAATKAAVRSHNIANINTPGFKGSRVIQTESESGPTVSSIQKSDEDPVSNQTEMEIARHSLAANARVVKKRNQMLGTILDLTK